MHHLKEETDPRAVQNRKERVAIGHKRRILLAEDDYEMCRLIASTLRKAGYNVTMCANGINLLSSLRATLFGEQGESYELIITDIRMPGVTGMEILAGLNKAGDAPPVILITAFGDAETHREAADLGAVTVLDKPFEMGELVRLVQRTLEH